jgi:glycosyltransferase involved in cell wall biosynthesis
LGLVDYLAAERDVDRLLRINDLYDGGSVAVSAAIARILDTMPVERMTQFLSPKVDDFARAGADAKAYRDSAARFSKGAAAEDALAMLRLIPKLIAPDDAARFYAREKSRLSRLAAHAVEKLGRRSDALEALAAVCLHFLEPSVSAFFGGADAAELARTLVAWRRQAEAPPGSRLARLRDDYFAFHLERRTGQVPEVLENDVRFTEAVFDYFYAVAQMRPALTAPADEALVRRLTRPTLALDGGRTLDVLTSWGLIQAQPKFSLAQASHLDHFHNWYLTGFFGARRMAPACLNPSLVSYFNEIVLKDELCGLPVTRYLRLTAKSPAWRKAFDLANLIDRNLFVLTLVAAELSSNTQFLPFLAPFLRAPDTVLARLIAALGGGAILEALNAPLPERPAARAGVERQDVLLIGHASKETGLGRNFGMLKAGLEGFNVTGLDFEAGADPFNDELRRWRGTLRSRPIAVFAVNAHDVPDAFVKDRDGVLLDSYCVGFYLWEVSRIPRLQALGVDLVDEIWAPTRYVASIYAPHKPTHVVGKGLFRGDEPFLSFNKAKGANPRFTFVTVFDFDSSIERKNPLAVVLAFQKAFAGSEKIELIVKTSNVNPRHWSNFAHQWERLTAAAASDRRIRIVTSRYSGEEMTALVRDADCIVSLHRSEGFGYLMSDAMAFGVPVIATDYSGNADFCSPQTSWPVPGRLIPVPAGAVRWHCDGAEWADPDIAGAAQAMRAVYEDYDAALAKAAHARENIRRAFGIDALRATLKGRVDEIAARG